MRRNSAKKIRDSRGAPKTLLPCKDASPSPSLHNTPPLQDRQDEDDVEGYRAGAYIAGVLGHCPEQNSETAADTDQSGFQDYQNQRWVTRNFHRCTHAESVKGAALTWMHTQPSTFVKLSTHQRLSPRSSRQFSTVSPVCRTSTLSTRICSTPSTMPTTSESPSVSFLPPST